MTDNTSSSRTLVFTVAMNGYQWLYRDFIKSHKQYATRHGYRHLKVSFPAYTLMGVECCWLKLSIIVEALQAGYQDVLFVDADAQISALAPPIQNVSQHGKYLYMAKGYSGHFNSGVIYAISNQGVISWLRHIIERRNQEKIEGDIVGWGENGHVIHHARHCDFIGTLPLEWNNTQCPNTPDYIRHYNHGPLRVNLRLRLIHKLLGKMSRLIAKFYP